MSVRRVVLLADMLGCVAALVMMIVMIIWPPPTPAEPTTWILVLGFTALTVVGQMAYVKLRHGATTEELNFFEVVLAASILLLAPVPALLATLTGVLIGELLMRRPWIKIRFNLGSYAASTSAMIVTYHALDGDQPLLSLRSVGALLVAALVFVAVNLAVLAQLLHVTAGADRRQVMTEEWGLSAFMAVGAVGVGAVAVALYVHDLYALLPFAAMPALALWYAYGAAAQHAEARERARFLVALGGALAQHGQGGDVLDEALESVQQVVGAPELLVLRPNPADARLTLRERRILDSVTADTAPRALAIEELPESWYSGVVTRLDLGTNEPGAVLLGSRVPYRHSRLTGRTQGWTIEESDPAVLGALVAAVGSAMRAGAAFDALTEETAKLSAVVDNTSDGIAMVDESGRVRLWSQTMARMTGVHGDVLATVEDLTGAPAIVQTLIQASWSAEDREDGPAAPVQVHLVRADGEELDVSVATVRVREAAATGASEAGSWVSILTVHDETRERRVERMKTDFVATISHELRTPITPIKGYAHLLASRGDRVTPEKRQQALQVIADRADHLARLVDDLVLASKVSDGARLKVEMGEEDLADVVRQAVSSFPALAPRIRVDLPERAVRVQCDRVRAVQCLSNLVGNAEKYTPADSPLEVRVVLTAMHAHIHVRDHGAGIPPEKQDKVFERFYRIEDPMTMKTGGAGLGLHIARELAVAMGGGLTLETPSVGTGAEFVLHLLTTDAPPFGAANHAMRPTAAPDTPSPAAPSPAPARGTMSPTKDSPLAALSAHPAKE